MQNKHDINSILNIAPHDLWQLLIDPEDMANGPARFEKEEPGYLKSMFSGLDVIFGKLDQELNADLIEQIHDAAVSFTRVGYNVGTGEDYYEEFPKGFRDNYAVCFGLVTEGEGKNCSREGLEELIKKIVAGEGFTIQEHNLEVIISKDSLPNPITPDYINQIWNQICKKRFSLYTGKEKQAVLKQYINARCREYYDQIALANNQQEKLLAVTSLVHDLEVKHVHPDGNCRNFAVLILKFLLLQIRMPPSVMAYRDRLDAFSVQEIKAEIENGMEHVSNLPHINVDPNVPIIFFKNNPSIAKYVATHCLATIDKWNLVKFQHKQKAIEVVQQVLLNYEQLTAPQLNRLLVNLTAKVAESIYMPWSSWFASNNTCEIRFNSNSFLSAQHLNYGHLLKQAEAVLADVTPHSDLFL